MMYVCHTPIYMICSGMEYPGRDGHSITSAVILNDLKCRFENTSFDYFKTFRVTIGPKKVSNIFRNKFIISNDYISA